MAVTQARHILFETEAKRRFLTGVDQIASLCAKAYGPLGGNVVVLSPGGRPTLVRNGLSLCRSVMLSDAFANMGIQAVASAAAKVQAEVGDGTKTTVMLARRLLHESLRALAANHNPNHFREGIQLGVSLALQSLSTQARPCNSWAELDRVWQSTTQDDSLSGILTRIVREVPTLETFELELGQRVEDHFTLSAGPEVLKGHQDNQVPHADPNATLCLKNPLVYISTETIEAFEQLAPALEEARNARRPLLVVAPDLQGAALQGLQINIRRKRIEAAFLMLRDADLPELAPTATIAAITGAIEHSPYAIFAASHLGEAQSIVMEAGKTTFIAPSGSKARIAEHHRRLSALYERGELNSLSPTAHAAFREHCEQELALLSGPRARLEVGGATDLESHTRLQGLQSALGALNGAIAEGVVPGAGLGLLRASQAILAPSDATAGLAAGLAAIRIALAEPFRLIGRHPTTDALDAVKTCRLAILTAAGVTGLVAQTSAMIARAPHRPIHFSAKEASQTREQFWNAPPQGTHSGY